MNAENKNTKERILEATREIVNQHGIEATSVREIAKRASVNIASINYYFGSKYDLMAEIYKKNQTNINNTLKENLKETQIIKNARPSEFVVKLFEELLETTYTSNYSIILDHNVQKSTHLNGEREEFIIPLGQRYIYENLGHHKKISPFELKRISFHLWTLVHQSLFLISQPLYSAKEHSDLLSIDFIKESLEKTSHEIIKEL
ncbi:MAG: helix-turn-helix domain-containing protein [Bdellovibrionota bacterium]|nr:helix-turn-helix domain-containing protein [Bdellovibrionota bacterium]